MDKIMQFVESHYEKGELYMEYKRDTCLDKTGERCEFCEKHSWVGPKMDRVPRPEPDYDSLPDYHYKSVFDSSNKQPSGETRCPDDFQPRKNLKVEFANNNISVTDQESITRFSNKFIVKENLVQEYLEHLQNMQRIKEIKQNNRQTEKERKKMKTYVDYEWEKLVESREIGKLYVAELDKYLDHHKLNKKGKKPDKVFKIMSLYMSLLMYKKSISLFFIAAQCNLAIFALRMFYVI